MNTPTEILVITNGKAVIVPADKWPEELELPCMFKCEVENDMRCACECKNLINTYERQKLEAIAQGAVVELNNASTFLDSIHAWLRKGLKAIDGIYPIDPSKWVVEKFFEMEDDKGRWIKQKDCPVHNMAAGANVRVAATIKPKAEDNSAHGYTEGSEYKMPTDFSKVYVEPAPAPTRKLVTQEMIDWMGKVKTSLAGEDERATLMFERAFDIAIAKAKDLKAKEIENLKQSYRDGKWEGNHIAIKGQRSSQDYISQTYQL